MGYLKHRVIISIENQHQIAAIWKRHPEIEDHNMQEGASQVFVLRSESIRTETGKGREAKERFSIAAWQDEQHFSLKRNREKPLLWSFRNEKY